MFALCKFVYLSFHMIVHFQDFTVDLQAKLAESHEI